jgi:hypothetical protein
MAAWKNLTSAQQNSLKKRLRDALTERGVKTVGITLEPSDLPGRYRLYVTAADFSRLDYSERLAMLSSALNESWAREDQLRLTLQFAQAPDEIPAPGPRGRARVRQPGTGRTRRRTA